MLLLRHLAHYVSLLLSASHLANAHSIVDIIGSAFAQVRGSSSVHVRTDLAIGEVSHVANVEKGFFFLLSSVGA